MFMYMRMWSRKRARELLNILTISQATPKMLFSFPVNLVLPQKFHQFLTML